jgi:phospholipid-transporting ATPase
MNLPTDMRLSRQFAFQNSFSGQVLEEGWTLTFYNVVFTVLPPIVLGVFDQFVGARMLDRYPELYKLGQQNKFVRAGP